MNLHETKLDSTLAYLIANVGVEEVPKMLQSAGEKIAAAGKTAPISW